MVDVSRRYLTENYQHDLVYLADKAPPVDSLLSQRLAFAAKTMTDFVEVNQQKASGVPVISGTRITLAQVLAELADGRSVGAIARTMKLDREMLAELLRAMAIHLDRSFL
jgi:uncharacterized protein (DUF433 family)